MNYPAKNDLIIDPVTSAASSCASEPLVIVYDLEDKVVGLNHACEENLGLKFEQVYGQRIQNLLIPESGFIYNGDYYRTHKYCKTFPQPSNHWLSQKDNHKLILWSNRTLTDEDGNITCIIATGRDITENREVNAHRPARPSYSSLHDKLTSLPNAVMFAGMLHEAISKRYDSHNRFAILLIRINEHGNINTLPSPHYDEKHLIIIAKRLKNKTPYGCTLAKWNSDEFIMLVTDIYDDSTMSTVTQDLLDCFVDPVAITNTEKLLISARIGISVFPDDSIEATELIEKASFDASQSRIHNKETSDHAAF